MAIHTVNDSAGWASIWVKEVQVASAATSEANVPKVDTMFAAGAKIGLIIDTPRQGEDGAWYATVDMAARIRVDDFSGAAADGAPAYLTSAGAVVLVATDNTRIGFVDGAKGTGTGKLIVQLVPQSA